MSFLLVPAALLQLLLEAVELSSHVSVTLLVQSRHVGHALLQVVNFLPLTGQRLHLRQVVVPTQRSAASSKAISSRA